MKNIAIAISTMNRSDFVIRQLEYYAKIKCPYPIYVGDASNEVHSQKIKKAIEDLSKDITVKYINHERFNTRSGIPKSHYDLYSKIKEEYCIFAGDDDYVIPDAIEKCAEFLEHNPGYSSASGHSVSFRLMNSGVYGELRKVADYPNYSIESNSAGQRLVDLWSRYYAVLFSVHRTKDLAKCWEQTHTVIDDSFSVEYIPVSMSVVLGKAKILDCLSIVRQLGNEKVIGGLAFDWLINKDWIASYNTFSQILAKEISKLDNISEEEALKFPKLALATYLAKTLPGEYIPVPRTRASKLKILRNKLGSVFPRFKGMYLGYKKPESFEVWHKKSPYYNDFKPILESFTNIYRPYRDIQLIKKPKYSPLNWYN